MSDTWTAIQFDRAVLAVGMHIDNQLQERFDDGTPKYSLPELLIDPDDIATKRAMNKTAVEFFKMMAQMPNSQGSYVRVP